MTTPHLARAHDLRAKLDHVAEVLRKRGWSVTVEAIGDATLAAAFMGVTFEGSPDMVRQLRDEMDQWAHDQGIALDSAVPSFLPEEMRPGEQRVGFYALFSRSKAA